MTAIDQFAGLGGFSEGARQAGINVVWCGNHWQRACDVHKMNHGIEPACQDLHQVDWCQLPKHDVGFSSPSCTGHTRARGKDRPGHDRARSTAWAVVSCAEVHREKLWIVENVPEFLKWELYPAWRSAMECLGYSVAPHILDAADFGVPQNRVRVFIICTRSKAPLTLKFEKRPHVAFEGSIDHLSGGWSPIRTKCAATRARVKVGRRTHGNRFLVAYYGSEKGGRALSRPIGTLPTKDRYALIEGNQMRMINVQEIRRAMGFRETYILPASSTDAKKMLGNAVCPPVAAELIRAAASAV